MRKDPANHVVAVLALPGVVALDLTIATHAFGAEYNDGYYDVVVCAEHPGPVTTGSGFALLAATGLRTVANADTVIVPGYDFEAVLGPRTTRALAAAHRRGARIASICTGAFALAAAGLLDARTATTHWMHADELAQRHPRITVDPDVLYVDNGSILTSAGVASGIDLCLHMLELDHGPEHALHVARRMVTTPHRRGGQAQFIPTPRPDGAGSAIESRAPNTEIESLAAWVRSRLSEPLTVAALARASACSTRSLHRLLRERVGVSPHAWLTQQRLDDAARRLREGEDSIERIAACTGLGTAANLRQHFRRRFLTTPTEYRTSFRAASSQQ